MAEFEINTITLPKITTSNDISSWFDQLEAIGFTKVYYNDTLQVNKMRWRDSEIGIYISGANIYAASLLSDNTVIQQGSIWNNITSYISTFYYRYIGNTNNILFSGTAANNPSQRLFCTFYSPEYEGDNWNIYNGGYVCYDPNFQYYDSSATNIAKNRYPTTSVALCPFWCSNKFKQKVFHVPVLPNLATYSIHKMIIGDKTYLINVWASSQSAAIAFDISEEFE